MITKLFIENFLRPSHRNSSPPSTPENTIKRELRDARAVVLLEVVLLSRTRKTVKHTDEAAVRGGLLHTVDSVFDTG